MALSYLIFISSALALLFPFPTTFSDLVHTFNAEKLRSQLASTWTPTSLASSYTLNLYVFSSQQLTNWRKSRSDLKYFIQEISVFMHFKKSKSVNMKTILNGKSW